MTTSRSFSGLNGPDDEVGSDGEVGLGNPGVESMARVSVTLPRSLYRQFRLHALEQDTTLSALMARLIRDEINGRN